MSHLAQLPSDPPALPLAHDEVLFIFKCEWDSVCSFWEHDAGANAVFVVPRSALGMHETAPPVCIDGPPASLRELGIDGFRADDDGTPDALEDAFYDTERHAALPPAIAFPHEWASARLTKTGGAPSWTANGAYQVPPGRLFLQLDTWVQVDAEEIAIANFCSDGVAYVFVDRSRSTPAYAMIINR